MLEQRLYEPMSDHKAVPAWWAVTDVHPAEATPVNVQQLQTALDAAAHAPATLEHAAVTVMATDVIRRNKHPHDIDSHHRMLDLSQRPKRPNGLIAGEEVFPKRMCE